MSTIKKIGVVLFYFIVFCLFLLPTTEVKAQDLGWGKVDTAAGQAKYDAATETTFSGNIGFLIQAVLSMLGVVFLILMAYAGYTWLMARGEEAEVEKAQKIIIAAVIGLIIVVAAYSITTFVVPKILNKTTGSGSESEVGGTKVECCSQCAAFAGTCKKQPMNQKECESSGWDYIGLKPASECK